MTIWFKTLTLRIYCRQVHQHKQASKGLIEVGFGISHDIPRFCSSLTLQKIDVYVFAESLFQLALSLV